MVKTNVFRMMAVFVCMLLCLVTEAGCRRQTEDEYYWHSYWEENEVPIEASDSSSNDTSSAGLLSSEVGSENDSSNDENSTVTVVINPNDKPSLKNTAGLLNPMSTKSDAQAEKLRNSILNTNDNLKISGTKYYISNYGDDDNDGKSPETAWKTISKIAKVSLKEGDAVLFERGGVYRGTIKAASGVTYAAYGTGDKPAIYQSYQNAAEIEWASAGENIWVAPGSYEDAGIVIFNHGELVGARKTSKKALKENGDYFCAGNILFLYMNRQPATAFNSIEIGTDSHIITISGGVHDVVIDNLTLKYTGAHGISALNGVENITVTNCEIGWIGGSYLNGFGDGKVRYGNGIEFWEGCKNVLVENCWVYQIYDSGLSHQGKGTFVVENLAFKCNLIEYVSMCSIEYWAPSKNINSLKNIEYSSNIMRFAGYGWGEIERPSHGAVHIGTTENDNLCENFIIKNNIFDTATNQLLSIKHLAGTLPILQGNTYIGKFGSKIGVCAAGSSMDNATYFIGEDSEEVLHNIYKDVGAKVLINE